MEQIFAAFRNSVSGLAWAARHERAVRQELWALAAALPLAAVIARDAMTFAALVGVILFVLAVELLNTGIEKLCDLVMPDRHPVIGIVKDVGSAAVLVSLMLAGMVWLAAIWRLFAG